MNGYRFDGGAIWRPLTLLLCGWMVLLPAGIALAGEAAWALGWEDGLTLRHRTAGGWVFSVAAGPDDYLHKSETRARLLADPVEVQGLLEVPEDVREEHGWVRAQFGREIRHEGAFRITAFGNLTYEWLSHQERQLLLDDLVHDYDTFELDRFTDRWILAVGLRPSWRVVSWLSVETAFGLRFVHDEWEQSTVRTHAGVEGQDLSATDGRDQQFQDFGFDGAASVQFFLWF